jgi:hypothetical protein
VPPAYVVRSDANRSAIHYDFSQDFLAHAAFPFMANDSPISSASLYVNFLWQQQTALPTLAHSGPDEAKRNMASLEPAAAAASGTGPENAAAGKAIACCARRRSKSSYPYLIDPWQCSG